MSPSFLSFSFIKYEKDKTHHLIYTLWDNIVREIMALSLYKNTEGKHHIGSHKNNFLQLYVQPNCKGYMHFIKRTVQIHW